MNDTTVRKGPKGDVCKLLQESMPRALVRGGYRISAAVSVTDAW